MLNTGDGHVELSTKLFKSKDLCVTEQIKLQMNLKGRAKLMCVEHEVIEK